MSSSPMVLHVDHPDGRRHQIALDPEVDIWIGRDASCDLVLGSREVSRRHAHVRRRARGAHIRDCSANGTWVGDDRLVQAGRMLTARDVVRIGPYVLRVSAPAPAHAGAGEAPAGGAAPSPAPPEDQSLQVEVPPPLRRQLHHALIEHLDLAKLDQQRMDPAMLRPKVLAALKQIVGEASLRLGSSVDRERLVAELCDEALGLGPLEQLLSDASVTEIMVVDPHTIFVEREGRIERTGLRFTDQTSVRAVIERIVTPLGRRIDESTPIVDARLTDGSRVNAVIPPLALKGPCITIRKFPQRALTLDDLVRLGSLSGRMARFLVRAVRVRRNIVISGGTGSGKTTLLNVLSSAIPDSERIVTIEDAAELQLRQPHVVALESRPANMEGKGAITIRDLVRNALRMRPDRIVVGECRGGEALDMLQAMNTGHEGSLTTTHANSPREALGRLETLCLMSSLDLPIQAIRQQIAASVHLIVQQSRFADGTRRVTSIAELCQGEGGDGIVLRELYRFRRTETDDEGCVRGAFEITGYMPSFVDQLLAHGLAEQGEVL